MRGGLFNEILRMSWETVRGNKMRSFLTVLGIVIGITSIVGMTSLIRGFDENFKNSIRSIGPDVVYISKFSGLSFASGKSFQELMKRPNLSPQDAEAIERDAPSIGVVDVILGQGGQQERGRRAGTENVPGIVGLGMAAEIAAYEDLRATNALDGFLLTSTNHGDRRADWLLEHDIPFVCFGRPWGRIDASAGAAAIRQALAFMCSIMASLASFIALGMSAIGSTQLL